MRNLQRFSQKRERLASGKMKVAWADVPYHFVINAAGQIAQGRDINFAGDTNTNYNPKNHIQIVLQGNFLARTTHQCTIAKTRRTAWVMQARRWENPRQQNQGTQAPRLNPLSRQKPVQTDPCPAPARCRTTWKIELRGELRCSLSSARRAAYAANGKGRAPWHPQFRGLGDWSPMPSAKMPVWRRQAPARRSAQDNRKSRNLL